MDSDTKKILNQIVNDKRALKWKMFWQADSNAMSTLSAFLFASSGKPADINKYVECRRYFKRHVNIFSEMRGIAEVIVITKMCLSDNYEEFLSGVTQVYKKLRKIHKLTASPYMVLAAMNIYEAGGIEKADENIASLEAIYKDMKADHFWLTGDSDRPFLAMMVSRNVNVSTISDEISACYEACKKMSFDKDAMHTVAQIMSLSGKNIDARVDDLTATMSAFKKYKLRGLKFQLMPMAATLGLIEADAETKASAIKEIYDYLKTQKGFKWYIGGTKRSLYSILAYAIENLEEDKTTFNSVISTTLTNIIIEEIIMFIIITTAANSTHQSSSSGSN